MHSNSLFSKIHCFKSEHIHSFLFREYYAAFFLGGHLRAKCSLQMHSNSLFSKIHCFKSEHIHSFLFREYYAAFFWGGHLRAELS